MRIKNARTKRCKEIEEELLAGEGVGIVVGVGLTGELIGADMGPK